MHFLYRYVGKRLNYFDFSESNNGDDIELRFEGINERLVVSHTFAIPFTRDKRGLKRFKNWLKPLPHWSNSFIGRRLERVDIFSHENNFCLEWEGDLALLINKNLITVYRDQKTMWTTMHDTKK